VSVAKVPVKDSQPDIRVSAGGIQPLCQVPMVGRTTAFVQTLLQRYTHSALPWSYPERVFRRLLPGMTWSPVYHQTHVQFAPRLSFTVLRGKETVQTARMQPMSLMPVTLTVLRGKETVHGKDPAQPAPILSLQTARMQPMSLMPVTLTVLRGKETVQGMPKEPMPLMPVTRMGSMPGSRVSTIQSIVEEQFVRQTLRRTLQQEDLVQRLVKQTKRIEAGVGMPTETLEVISPTFQPANRVVRRTGAVLVESEVKPPTPEQSWMAPKGFPGISQGQPVGGTNAVDVNRLTDQVIQAIDRRMTAYRERLGRS
jgi:hypothetical protein